ncbi:g877 [Coccomyxa elongata]
MGSKRLMIVESSTKIKTLTRFLPPDIVVKACFGHVSDLPKRELGIDIGKQFRPHWRELQEKKGTIEALKRACEASTTVILATDPDLEGEAIAWHLTRVLKLAKERVVRVAFCSVTEAEVLRALHSPRKVDRNLVDAQIARRIVDRLVGYRVSPILWRHLKSGLSAGRVQSAALRLLVEREREIEGFQPERSWLLTASFEDGKVSGMYQKSFAARDEAREALEGMKDHECIISHIDRTTEHTSAPPPLRTSTLQQEAGSRFGMSPKVTMTLAQGLYEAGHITYHRTDSVDMSPEAMQGLRTYISGTYGERYLAAQQRSFRQAPGAQLAHECIRPTSWTRTAITGGAERLYDLIWTRAVASQMARAAYDVCKLQVPYRDSHYLVSARSVEFDGFLRASGHGGDSHGSGTMAMLASLKCGQRLTLHEGTAREQLTSPPPRYSESGFVKELERCGLGRPSTYATIVTTLQDRQYCESATPSKVKQRLEVMHLREGEIAAGKREQEAPNDRGRLTVTEIGQDVYSYLDRHFGCITDIAFTRELETELDRIAAGSAKWVDIVRKFHDEFGPTVDALMKTKALEKRIPRAIREVRRIGRHPDTGQMIETCKARYGPVVKMGDGYKTVFAKIDAASMDSLDLNAAVTILNRRMH